MEDIYSDHEDFNSKRIIRCAGSNCGDTISFFYHPELHIRTVVVNSNWSVIGGHNHCSKCTVILKKENELYKMRMKEIKLKYGHIKIPEPDDKERDWKDHWGWWTREDDRASELF